MSFPSVSQVFRSTRLYFRSLPRHHSQLPGRYKVEQQKLRKTASQRVGSYFSFYPKKDYKREGSTSREKPKETTKPLAKDTSTPPIRTRDVKCFKCYGRGHVQAQCPNQRTLFLKGVDEYTSGEDEPSEREEGGEDDRVAPLEGELLMIRRTLNNQPSTSMETQRENIYKMQCFRKYMFPHCG